MLTEEAQETELIPAAEVVEITPEGAQQYLELNTKNRALNEKHVLYLAEQMRLGAWQMAYDPIRISVTNVLLDGQHRLMAIVKSGTTQRMLVIRNLPDETFTVMDTGRLRSANDVLTIAGYTHGRASAALVRMIVNYQNGRVTNTLSNIGRVAGAVVTHQEILDYIQSNDVHPYIKKGLNWYAECKFLTGTEYSFFYYIFSRIDPEGAEVFLNSFASGAELKEKNPIFVLRKKLETYKVNRIQVTPTEKLAFTFKAWNLFREGKSVGYLTFNKDKEDIPTPI